MMRTTTLPSIHTLFLVLALTLNHAKVGALSSSCDADDPISCRGGMLQCTLGEKTYDPIFEDLDLPFLFQSDKRGMHCECGDYDVMPGSSGYTGVHCDTKYQVCGDSTVCLHGGVCEKSTNFQSGSQYHCLCPQNERSGDIYVGENCAYKVEEKGICEQTNSVTEVNDGKWFCANGGICDDWENNLEEKCHCLSDEKTGDLLWSGLHCEFPGPEAPTCNLICENGGTCRHGGKDYDGMDGLDTNTYLGGSSIMGQHCVCPEGYSGSFCQVQILVPCGLQGFCFNDQECLTVRTMDGEIFSEECVCDWKFGGKYCELEEDDMEKCPFPKGHDPSGYYCANGGICPPEPFLPCSDCDEGYYGPRCEMYSNGESEPNYEDDCNLECQNGGTCYFGSNPKDDDDALLGIPGYMLDPVSSMHCRCEEGFIGLNCEIRFASCGEDEHFCLHGSTCVSDNDEYTCDCENALGSYAGQYCQSVATEFCTHTYDDPTFCTNHGTCQEVIDRYGEAQVQCNCKEGFEGDWCETLNLSTNGAATIFFVTFTVLLAIGAIGTVIVKRRGGKENVEGHTLIRPAMQNDEYEERDVQIT